MSTTHYAEIMEQRAEILRASSGIDYACYTTGALAFDYEQLFADTGYDVESANAVQRRTAVGNTPLIELGNITPMLENIRPAVEHCADYEGEKSSKNPEYVHLVAERNVRMTFDGIRQDSVILAEMEASEAIKIVGGLYNMSTGMVDFLAE